MREIGIFEAKAQFSQLVQAAEAGEEIVVTRHGTPVVRMVAAAAGSQPFSSVQWAAELREYRVGRDKGARKNSSLAALIAAGRR